MSSAPTTFESLPVMLRPGDVSFKVVNARTFKAKHGVTVGAWAKGREYDPSLVYAIVSGKRKCVRGVSLRIARELGLKG
jgi:gp16 family phage-associated protein